jgi:type IV secretory pathway VirB10-like protein
MTDATDIPQVASPSPPSSAPVDLRLRDNPPRVMRLSRKAMVALGLGVCAGVGGSLIYALQPTVPRVAEELLATEGRATAEGLAAAPKDYGQIPKLGPPLPGDLGRPILAAQERGADVPVPAVGAQPNHQATAADAARQHAAQERDSARASRLFLGGAVATSVPTDGATNCGTSRPTGRRCWCCRLPGRGCHAEQSGR